MNIQSRAKRSRCSNSVVKLLVNWGGGGGGGGVRENSSRFLKVMGKPPPEVAKGMGMLPAAGRLFTPGNRARCVGQEKS